MPKKRIALIGTDWNANSYRRLNNVPGAISTYRLIYPMRFLSEYYDIRYYGSDFVPKDGISTEEFYENLFNDYDLVISKVTDNPQAAAMLRFFATRNNVPLVVDIDDNIWELKPDQPGYKAYEKGGQTLAIASTYVSLADAVFCSTKPLAEYIQKRIKAVFNEDKNTFVLPNCVDTSDYSQYERAQRDPSTIVIGWQGSTTHHEDLRIAMPAINRLLVEYPNLYLELLGGVSDEMVADLFNGMDETVLDRVMTKGGVPAFDTFPHLLSQQAWDIAIAPLTDEPFNHAKSHIKWMEYAMFGIPCVASKVYPYYMPVQDVHTINDGETGVLAGPDQWYNKLKYLIDEPTKADTIGRNAKEYVSNHWHMRKHAHKWKEAIDSLINTQG